MRLATKICKAPTSQPRSFKAGLILKLVALSLTGLAIDTSLLTSKSAHALASQSPNLPVAQKNSTTESICPAQLGTAIEAVMNRPQFRRARWGILVESLSPKISDRALYNLNGDRYFIPASNTKLLTTAAALLALGSDYRIRTSVYDGGKGVLRVVGRGDPSFTNTQLKDLAQQLRSQGIRTIKNLILEDSYLQGNVVNPTWEWEDIQFDYGTSVNSLILNQNAVELTLSPQQPGQPLRVSWSDAIASRQWKIENQSMTAEAGTPNSVTVTAVLGQPVLRIKGQLPIDGNPETFDMAILDPANNFLQHFRNALALEGITVQQASVISKISTNQKQELAAVESPPLSLLVFETNQESNNLYAEVLLRTLPISAQQLPDTSPNRNSADIGLQQLKATLTALGVDPESYIIVDGSGLSRHNLVSPKAIAQTLQLMAKTPQARVYRDSLPVAGVSGTLKNRFRNTMAQGNIQAKTGSMTGVSALSGYLDVPGYQPLVFSIMVNQSEQSLTTLRQGIDEIVLLLTRLRSC
ncbi:D-alanyl-D-alanine carboxypeptidase/D-alanyl-D-alanine-endopeptidase [Microcoleus sp. FACHB-1]|nr:D-alanyl-D-alanine carboxypeptidase/D-alanyl-D-alanine-endopeptidase [Microcoleus sp. FACHB-1]